MNPEIEQIRSEACNCLEKIRASRPLVHNITNMVAMNLSANALLAVGASPIMAHAQEELEEMVGLARTLVLNPGTLDADWLRSMRSALDFAQTEKRPVVLDPVGAGASKLRTTSSLGLLAAGGISVLRGNASEILALVNSMARNVGGVDSHVGVDSSRQAAVHLSQKYRCVVVVSGPLDLVTDQQSTLGQRTVRVANGDSGMTSVTGMGCVATSLIGAALAVCVDPFIAALAGMAISGVAGEIAAKHSQGPGSFAVAYLDALGGLTPAILDQYLRIVVEEA